MSEREEENLDLALREAMSATAPVLSSDFDRRLDRRLRPRPLSFRARLAMVLYTLAALAATVWAMWSLPFSVDWPFVILLVLVPLSFIWTLRRLARRADRLVRLVDAKS